MANAPVTPCINEALPEEVFRIIFEEHARLEWRAPAIDGQVCRHWRDIILRSPRAWAHLEMGYWFRIAPSKLHQWLDRSGSAPLHIQVTLGAWDVVEILDQHHKRIESISMYFYSKILALFENRSFRILQSLTIRGSGGKDADTAIVHWSSWHAMPELRSLQFNFISVDALPSNPFPPLKVLALDTVNNCDLIIRTSYHSLTSLMLYSISLPYTTESLEFPSLKYLSLFAVENVKRRMNVPALATYHEAGIVAEESFSMSSPLLTEYGICRLQLQPPLNVTRLHQRYPNISRLSVRARPSDFKLLLRSLRDQPTALPRLGLLAVEAVYGSIKYTEEDKHSMTNDVFVRNMASGVKMELCFDGKIRVPLYLGRVRVYLNEGRSELTPTIRTRIDPFEDLSFVLSLWLCC